MNKLYFVLIIIITFCGIESRGQDNNNESGKMKQNDKSTVIQLPDPEREGIMSVEEALEKRRSVRSYKPDPLSLEVVSQLLWAAYGITKNVDGGPSLRGGLRTTPSAGALYPLEIYLVAGDVTGLDPGIYRYDSEYHRLKQEETGDVRKKLSNAALGQSMISNAPACIFYSVIPERTTKKYGERGEKRYICADLGHSAENVYLQATALGLGTCAVGAFEDNRVRKVMKLPPEEDPLYIMPVGYLKDRKD